MANNILPLPPKAFDSIGGGLYGRLFERQVPRETWQRALCGQELSVTSTPPASPFRRAPRDSQDSFTSSPLVGSQAAMSATVWLFVKVRHSGGKPVCLCSIPSCA